MRSKGNNSFPGATKIRVDGDVGDRVDTGGRWEEYEGQTLRGGVVRKGGYRNNGGNIEKDVYAPQRRKTNNSILNRGTGDISFTGTKKRDDRDEKGSRKGGAFESQGITKRSSSEKKLGKTVYNEKDAMSADKDNISDAGMGVVSMDYDDDFVDMDAVPSFWKRMEDETKALFDTYDDTSLEERDRNRVAAALLLPGMIVDVRFMYNDSGVYETRMDPMENETPYETASRILLSRLGKHNCMSSILMAAASAAVCFVPQVTKILIRVNKPAVRKLTRIEAGILYDPIVRAVLFAVEKHKYIDTSQYRENPAGIGRHIMSRILEANENVVFFDGWQTELENARRIVVDNQWDREANWGVPEDSIALDGVPGAEGSWHPKNDRAFPAWVRSRQQGGSAPRLPPALKKRADQIRGSGPTAAHKIRDWLGERQRFGNIIFQSVSHSFPSLVPFRFAEGMFPIDSRVNMLIAQQYANFLGASTNSHTTRSIRNTPQPAIDGELLIEMVDAMENFVLLPGIFNVGVAFGGEKRRGQCRSIFIIDKLLRLRDERIKGTFMHAQTIVRILTQHRNNFPVLITVTVNREAVIRHGTQSLNKIFGKRENHGIDTSDLAFRREMEQLTERVLLKAVAEVEDIDSHRIIQRSYVTKELEGGNNIDASEQDANRYYFTLSALGYLLKNTKGDAGMLAKIHVGRDGDDGDESYTGDSYTDTIFEKMFTEYRVWGYRRFNALFCGWLMPMFKRHFLEVPKMVFAGDGESVWYDYFNDRKELEPIELCLGMYSGLRFLVPSEKARNFLGHLERPDTKEAYYRYLSSCPKVLEILDLMSTYIQVSVGERMDE
jgi:hypothetical protein